MDQLLEIDISGFQKDSTLAIMFLSSGPGKLCFTIPPGRCEGAAKADKTNVVYGNFQAGLFIPAKLEDYVIPFGRHNRYSDIGFN